MTTKVVTKKYRKFNLFKLLINYVHYTWIIMSTEHTSFRGNPLFVTALNGKSIRVTRREQVIASCNWFIISVINLVANIFGPALKGILYGYATFNKYLLQGGEAHDLMTGIMYDMNDALKHFLIVETKMGAFLDSIANSDIIQLLVILACIAWFGLSIYFVYWTHKQIKHHKRHPMYCM